ncbi:MAG: amidohydrolase family protein [Gemmatimonadetes bacterium]|nr:amidohydrolase family protein [Gemmatimonadota bacterium]
MSTSLSRRALVRTATAAGLSSLAAPTIVHALGALAATGRHGERSAGELLIRGGRVVNADGVVEADVRIVETTIAEVGRSLAPGAGARVIDARGKLVLPGGIDPHTHLHPGFADDMTSGSMAALAGGITTVGTFSTPRQGETPLAALDRMAATVQAEAIADVILHSAVWPPTDELIAMLPQLAARGQPSIKFYMVRPDFGAQMEMVVRVLEAAREAGVVTMLHCEDGALLAAAVRRLTAAGNTSLEHYIESRPVIAEVVATQQAAALAESTGAPIYLVHMSSARALDACAGARAAGLPLYLETRPLFIHLSEEKLRGPDYQLYVGQPPLRPRADVDAMMRGLIDGRIDVLATDHAPWTRAQKLDPALSIARVRPGASDLQFMLPMFFSEGVGKRKLTLPRFVETTSTNAAKIFGMYPQKGVIRAGSDADVAIWDPRRTAAVLAVDDLSKSDYSPYEGWQVTGWPVTVIRRGEVVVEAGAVSGSAGSGRLVERQPWRRSST